MQAIVDWFRRHIGVRRRLLSLLARAPSTQREITVALTFLLVLTGVGTIGYMLLEGWSWVESLYMTFITLTTIGFAEVHPLSTTGRLFTIVIAITGIGAAGFIATRLAQLFLHSQNLRERRIARLIDRMENHLIICGYGRIGRRIIQDLQQSDGQSFVIVDVDEERIEQLQEQQTPCVEGDAQDEETLRAAGIERARGLIVALPEDSTAVFVTLTAREIAREANEDLKIIARTNDHKNRSKLLTAGADKVIAPIEVGADRMAQVIVRPNVDQFMEEVLGTGALGLQMEEVRVCEGAPLAGKTLANSNFRQQFEAVVVAIIDSAGDHVNFNPNASARIEPGNVLVVLGNQDMIQRLRQEGCT